MNRWEMQKYELSAGSRAEAVRVIKELLHQNPRNSYQKDGTNVFDGKLQAALAEFQRAAGLPNKNGTLDEQTWAMLGAGASALRLQQMTTGQIDTQLYGLLLGAFVGGGLRASASNFAMKTNESGGANTGEGIKITFDSEWFVENDFGKEAVLAESKELMDTAAGLMATNIFRAIVSHRALTEFPTLSTKTTFEGSVELGAKGKKIVPESGGFKVGVEFETASGDMILKELRVTNDNIRMVMIVQLKSHGFMNPEKAKNLLPHFRRMGDVPANDAPNFAASFGNTVTRVANESAHRIYKELNPKRDVPSVFLYKEF